MRIGSALLLIVSGCILVWAVDVGDSTYGSVTVDWSMIGVFMLLAGCGWLGWLLYLTSAWHDRQLLERSVEHDLQRLDAQSLRDPAQYRPPTGTHGDR